MSAGSTRTESQSAALNPRACKNQLSEECDSIREDFQLLVDDVGSSIQTYCTKRPLMAGLMIFAIGFYVGWKVKPW